MLTCLSFICLKNKKLSDIADIFLITNIGNEKPYMGWAMLRGIWLLVCLINLILYIKLMSIGKQENGKLRLPKIII